MILIHVNIVHVIVYIYYASMSKATCKINFNVQFIVNRIDFILFAANVQLVDQIHWYMIIANIRFITTKNLTQNKI